MEKLPPSWQEVLKDEFDKPYMRAIDDFLRSEKESGQLVYPPEGDIFSAFRHTPFDRVKVLILGQDPYHGAGQANGLCFSVHRGVPMPPSLRNIGKELRSDLGLPLPAHGDLTQWAAQGVLLLNAVLTVRAGQAGSHRKAGWEQFTDEVIRHLDARPEGMVFLLWGNFARSKKHLIRHHPVLEAAHPSPLSAHSGFFGCRHFSAANALLVEKGLSPIDWQIT